KPEPRRRRGHELGASERGQPVIFRAPSIRRCLPLSGNPPPLEQSLQGGVQGAVIHEKFIIGLLLEKPRNPICVIRSRLEALKDQHFERPLQELQPFPRIVYPWIVYRRHTTHFLQESIRCQAQTSDCPTLLTRLDRRAGIAEPRWKQSRTGCLLSRTYGSLMGSN